MVNIQYYNAVDGLELEMSILDMEQSAEQNTCY